MKTPRTSSGATVYLPMPTPSDGDDRWRRTSGAMTTSDCAPGRARHARPTGRRIGGVPKWRTRSATSVAHHRAAPAPADEPDQHRGADERGHDARGQFGGPDDDSADDVGGQQQRRCDDGGVRQDPAPVRPGERRTTWGTISPTKPIGPGARGRRTCHRVTATSSAPGSVKRCRPCFRQIVAERIRVQRPADTMHK